jgi:hypothetical protein
MVTGHCTETFTNKPSVDFFLARSRVNWVDLLLAEPRFFKSPDFSCTLRFLFRCDNTDNQPDPDSNFAMETYGPDSMCIKQVK